MVANRTINIPVREQLSGTKPLSLKKVRLSIPLTLTKNVYKS